LAKKPLALEKKWSDANTIGQIVTALADVAAIQLDSSVQMAFLRRLHFFCQGTQHKTHAVNALCGRPASIECIPAASMQDNARRQRPVDCEAAPSVFVCAFN
jgi:hypothetical protein